MMGPVGADRARAAGVSRIVRLHEDDGAFDRAFWAGLPPSRRLEAVWDLVLEYLAWREPHAPESRLQRSVCRVERRRG
jgi:hypothetical protein